MVILIERFTKMDKMYIIVITLIYFVNILEYDKHKIVYGGEIDFVSYENGELTVLLQGECSKCLIVDRCLRWIESEVMRDMGESVKVIAQKKKPFFWDKD